MKKENSKNILYFLVFALIVFGGIYLTKSAKEFNKNRPSDASSNTANQGEAIYIPPTSEDFVRGAQNPQLYFVEYSDLDCPYCKRFHGTMQNLMAKYSDKIAWVYRQFPLTIHEFSEKKSLTSLCIAKLYSTNDFFKYTDKMMSDLSSDEKDNAIDVAINLGFDQNKIETCVNEDLGVRSLLDKDISDAEASGLTGTPFTLVFDNAGNMLEIVQGSQSQSTVEKIILKYTK